MKPCKRKSNGPKMPKPNNLKIVVLKFPNKITQGKVLKCPNQIKACKRNSSQMARKCPTKSY